MKAIVNGFELNGNGMNWELPNFDYSTDGTELPNGELITLTLPKLSKEQSEALIELKRLAALEMEAFNGQIQASVKQLTDELHKLHPEMQGRTLEECGLNPVIRFEDGQIIITIEPI